jgi:hypothetical protein
MATEVAVERKKAGRRLPVVKGRQTDRMRPAALWLLLMGAISLAIWYFTNDDSMMSMLLALAAISTVTLSVLLFFLSPTRSIRNDVCDAMAISGTLEIRKILSSLNASPQGIYLPMDDSDAVQLYVPVADMASVESILSSNPERSILFASKDGEGGLVLMPPGYGLYQHVRKIGARFTGVNLEDEIGDALENSLELADKVTVDVEGDIIRVTLKNLANHGLCKSVRREDPAICCQTGCPICSAISCMIVNGTGRMVSVESIRVSGKTLSINYRLIGD